MVSPRMLGLRNLRGVQNFVCPRCVEEEESGDGSGDEDVGFEVNGGVLEEVQQFWLGDMLDCEVGTERAVRLRVAPIVANSGTP
ncbi:hypothetical protein E2C01_031960 [Portunus trituberculatus]|uniref:Uncharacterized protein n=1 Tax=Portunus trituberculatus TaxID=210409 RepID=A0A5B7F027_PORTR|nr:hypothetical protein [Portunus trituberculatus]